MLKHLTFVRLHLEIESTKDRRLAQSWMPSSALPNFISACADAVFEAFAVAIALSAASLILTVICAQQQAVEKHKDQHTKTSQQ